MKNDAPSYPGQLLLIDPSIPVNVPRSFYRPFGIDEIGWHPCRNSEIGLLLGVWNDVWLVWLINDKPGLWLFKDLQHASVLHHGKF